jgi:cytochrome c oxidase subunit 3
MKRVIEGDVQSLRARKFLMWLFVISSFMFFAALTSGFIVYTGGSAERGIKIVLPQIFKFSTGAIILSSITMYRAYWAAKRLDFTQEKRYLVFTILLGILFFAFQLLAWHTLIEEGVYFVNYNASQSFIYVFTGAHLLHIIFGIFFLTYTLLGCIKNIPHNHNLFRLEVTSIFWHFIDILWIYLYVFLLLGQ